MRSSVQVMQPSGELSKEGMHARFRLEGRVGEWPHCGIWMEQYANSVSDANCDKFLGQVNFIAIDMAKGLCDGDVFEQKDDGCDK